MEISSILTNTTLQAFLFSPLMGIIFAAIFSGSNRVQGQLVTVHQKRTTVVNNYYVNKSKSKSTQDDRDTLIFLGLGMLFLIWFYSLHAEIVHQILILCFSTAFYFTLTSVCIAYWKERIRGERWILVMMLPVLSLFFGLYLALEVNSNFPNYLSEVAKHYGFVQFYITGLDTDERIFLIDHTVGILFLSLLAIQGIATSIHYAALMSSSPNGNTYREWIEFKTRHLATVKWGVLMLIFASIAFLFLEGHFSLMAYRDWAMK